MDFLNGPVPSAWLMNAAKLPGRSLHVGMVLWYAAGLSEAGPVHLSNKLCLRFGLDRNAKYRALAWLENAGLIAVRGKKWPHAGPVTILCPERSILTARPRWRLAEITPGSFGFATPRYLGMDRNQFNAEVRPYLTEVPIGKQGIGFDRLELDAWFEDYKSRNGRPRRSKGVKSWDASEYPVSSCEPGIYHIDKCLFGRRICRSTGTSSGAKVERYSRKDDGRGAVSTTAWHTACSYV